MPHAVLLGDSIFDNAAYVPGGPPVIDQLKAGLPLGWKATLLAVDGDTTDMVAVRLAGLPADATHLMVSVGGNDALMHIDLLAAEHNILPEMSAARAEFADRYRAMLDAVLTAERPTAICTVYDAIPGLTAEARTALATFNDVILREAARARLPVLDLRLVCDDPGDYSPLSPIEPSAQGGAKIAALVASVVTGHDFARRECVVYGKAGGG
ncbi:MAG TPA: SGNH/GDSL hydrolase family protein [Gemmataceae bacterium]|nr:SGNH/GDSL hydrolase family protein [Gemmataceae bacterium]